MWIWLGSILFLLLLLLILIMISKITITLKATKENRNEMVLLEISALFGLVAFHYQIPAMVFKNIMDGLWLEKNRSDTVSKGNSSSNEQEINKELIDKWADQFSELIKGTTGLKKWLKSTLRRLSVVSLEWSTNVALHDAAHTATLTGALWGVKATLIGWLTHQLSLRQRPKLFVVPVFGSPPLFTTKLFCIAEIRCGYAIHAGLVLIVRVLKVKGGVKKWLSILFKD